MALFDEFVEAVSGYGWDLTPVRINGKFVKFMDPDIDNMWLGFCASKGMLDQALNREKDVLERVIPQSKSGS